MKKIKLSAAILAMCFCLLLTACEKSKKSRKNGKKEGVEYYRSILKQKNVGPEGMELFNILTSD